MVNPRLLSETHSVSGPLDDRYKVPMEGEAGMISRASKVEERLLDTRYTCTPTRISSQACLLEI